MPDYHARKLPVVTEMFENRSPETTVKVLICDECGALVVHTSQHNEWHIDLATAVPAMPRGFSLASVGHETTDQES